MATIEYKVGSESHSSSWGKFYVKGLEKYEVKEGGEREGIAAHFAPGGRHQRGKCGPVCTAFDY